MNTYDVEAKVMVRIEVGHQGDAEIQVYLQLEQALYGGIMMPPADEMTVSQARIEERIERTGIDVRVVKSERVVTAKPYPL